MKEFSEEIKNFIQEVDWVFAKTYAKTWPHEYIVHDRVDKKLFYEMAHHIRNHGYQGNFYRSELTYFDEEGITYWTMCGPEGTDKWYPLHQTQIINRCPKENTYEERLKRGDLPSSENELWKKK